MVCMAFLDHFVLFSYTTIFWMNSRSSSGVSVSGTECYLRFSSLAKTAAAAIPGSANRLINYLKSSSGTVELRRAKFEGSGTLGYFIPGTGVIVLSRNADEGWAYIQVGSTKGYVDLANLNRNP